MNETPSVAKTIILPAPLWKDIIAIRHDKRITTQAEAVRMIIAAGVDAIREKDAKDNRVRQNQHDRPGRRT